MSDEKRRGVRRELTYAAIELLAGIGHLQTVLNEPQPRIAEQALAKREARS